MKPKQLVIDVGNSRIKTAVFQDFFLLEATEWATAIWDRDVFLNLATNPGVQNIIYSSVAEPLPAAWKEELPRRVRLVELDSATKLPFINTYQTPETLGKDRLAAVAGAQHLYPGTSLLIADAGTCITYDLLNARGEYLGGNISPGLHMRYRAMHTFTARLPQVDWSPTPDWIGTSTEKALRNGGLWGMIWELEGCIGAAEEKLGKVRAVLTGGDAEILAKYVKREIFVHPQLVLTGLNKILQYHVESLD